VPGIGIKLLGIIRACRSPFASRVALTRLSRQPSSKCRRRPSTPRFSRRQLPIRIAVIATSRHADIFGALLAPNCVPAVRKALTRRSRLGAILQGTRSPYSKRFQATCRRTRRPFHQDREAAKIPHGNRQKPREVGQTTADDRRARRWRVLVRFPAQMMQGFCTFGRDDTIRVNVEPKAAARANRNLRQTCGCPNTWASRRARTRCRGGRRALVRGSRVTFVPTVNRPLRNGPSNGKACPPTGASSRPRNYCQRRPANRAAVASEFGLRQRSSFRCIPTQDDRGTAASCEIYARARS